MTMLPSTVTGPIAAPRGVDVWTVPLDQPAAREARLIESCSTLEHARAACMPIARRRHDFLVARGIAALSARRISRDSTSTREDRSRRAREAVRRFACGSLLQRQPCARSRGHRRHARGSRSVSIWSSSTFGSTWWRSRAGSCRRRRPPFSRRSDRRQGDGVLPLVDSEGGICEGDRHRVHRWDRRALCFTRAVGLDDLARHAHDRRHRSGPRVRRSPRLRVSADDAAHPSRPLAL